MRSHWIARAVSSAPVLVPLFAAVLTAVCTTLLLLELFWGPLALLLALGVTVLLGRSVGLGPATVSRRAFVVDALALGLALLFALVNAAFAAQNLVVSRDPGVYAVTAKWLTQHRSLDIDAAPALLGNVLSTGSAGFGGTPTPGHLYAQGAHGLPAVLAVGGSLLGDSMMLKLNCLIGGLALLAVYGFARLVVGRWPALLTAALVGASLPQVAFSRDTYTEPLSQLFLFGGLALLWRAPAGRPGRHALAGFVLAASCLTRIDAFLVLPPVVVYVAVQLAVTPVGARATALRDAVALAAGAFVPAWLGRQDLKVLAPGYYRDLNGQFTNIYALLLLAALAGAALVAVCWRTPLLAAVSARARDGLAAASAFGVVLLGALLAARPLFQVSHGSKGPQVKGVAALQAVEKVPVDGTRDYTEHSVAWLSWYVGVPVLVLGLIGLAVLVHRLVKRGRIRVLPFVAVLLVTALLYLVKPSITPNHIWAARRYVPVVFPGLALCAALVVAEVVRRLPLHWRPALAVPVAALLAVPALHTTSAYAVVREGVPQLAEVHAVCDRVHEGDGVVMVGHLGLRYAQTVRSFCGARVGVTRVVDPVQLSQAATAFSAATRRTLWVLGAEDARAGLVAASSAGAPPVFHRVTTIQWAYSLTKPPKETVRQRRELYLGRLGQDGKVASWVSPTA